MKEKKQIVICRCAECGIGSAAVRNEVLAWLRKRRLPFAEVPDLCRLVANKSQWLVKTFTLSGFFFVIACHPRAVRHLLAAAGIVAGCERFLFMDMRAQSSADIIARLPSAAAGIEPPTETADSWSPWFPVIDSGRCHQCRQCINFCLFGVYTLDSVGKVVVSNPRACKNNCPACARICPEAAIIFPKLPDSEAPLNGAEIINGQDLKEKARLNMKELLGNDVYTALAQRRKQALSRLLKPDKVRFGAPGDGTARLDAANKMPAAAPDDQPER